MSLALCDVATLTSRQKEYGLRQVDYSEKRRVDPQIVVGPLVERTGLPLEIGCSEGV